MAKTRNVEKVVTAPVRQVVLVLAMHRTGSSAVTRVLNLLGCDAAKTLIGPDEHNESGYWESDVLRVFNDKLLASGGSDWRDWQAFNPGWYRTPRLEEYLNRGQELLKAEFGTSDFFVLKDPRVPRIVPFWRQLLTQAGAKPHVIMTLRHPEEVAASLAKRDAMNSAEAALLWLRNMLEAEQGSRGLVRVIVDYDQLIAAPSATMTAIQQPLGLIWPRLSSKVLEEIDAFMSPASRHHKIETATRMVTGQPFREWLNTVYSILQRWSVSGEDEADWPALDTVREAMNELATPLREMVTMLTRQSEALTTKEKDIRHLRGEAGERGEAVTALTAEKQALSDELARLHDTSETRIHELETALTTAETRSHTLVEELEQREAELVTLQAEHSVLRSTLEQRTHELDETREEQVRSEAARRAESALNATLGAELEETKTGLARARSELDDLRATAKGDGLELKRRAAKVAELEKALANSAAELAERNRAMASQHQRLTILDETATVQARELARLAQMTIEKEEALKRRNATAHEAEVRATEHQRELAESEGRVQELLNSTSWRITAPLRRLSLAFGRKR